MNNLNYTMTSKG